MTGPRIIVNLTIGEEYCWRVLELAGFRFEWVQETDWRGNDVHRPPRLSISAPSQHEKVTRFIVEGDHPGLAIRLAWEWWWGRIWRAYLTPPAKMTAP